MCSAISIMASYTIHAVVAFLMNVETCFRLHLDGFSLAFTRVGIYGDRYTFLAACSGVSPHRHGLVSAEALPLLSLQTYTDGCLWFIPKSNKSLVRACLGGGGGHLPADPGRYDLILSFNLLQRSYYPPDIIEAGVQNLAASLCEGGLLIIGNEWEIFPCASETRWPVDFSPARRKVRYLGAPEDWLAEVNSALVFAHRRSLSPKPPRTRQLPLISRAIGFWRFCRYCGVH